MTDQPIRQYPDELREQAETDMLYVFPPEAEPDDPAAGPTVAECRRDDLCWPLESEGL